MILLSVYVALCIAFETLATVAGFYFEEEFPAYGLPVYLAAFFIILIAMWPIAIRLTRGEEHATVKR